MRDPVRVYHPGLDAYAVIARKTVPIRERKGWRVPGDDSTTSDSEEPTPPSGANPITPEKGEE